jgi:hypothetical protein
MPVNLPSIGRRAAPLLALAAACALSGCAMSPNIDRQFGASARAAVLQQTLDPRAGDDRRPVNGLDAQAAAAAYENYQRSYSSQGQQQQSGFTIGSGLK